MDKRELSEQELEQVALENARKTQEAIRKYQEKTGQKLGGVEDENPMTSAETKAPDFNQETYEEKIQQQMQRDEDPDLVVSFDYVTLPSKGKFYEGNMRDVEKVKVEYMTAMDEDILTTPEFQKDGTLMEELLKRKIKDKRIGINKLLVGDKEAILLFLRASAYGGEYRVKVTNPYTGEPFEDNIDITKFDYKKVAAEPDDNLLFTYELPLRKKEVKFRLLNAKEITDVIKQAAEMKENKLTDILHLGYLRILKSVVSINGKTDRDYINRFVKAMPAGDSMNLRKFMNAVSPGVDTSWTFVDSEKRTFKAPFMIGPDFFFLGS